MKDDILSVSRQERLVMMAPYVAPEHRELLADAENMLREYEKHLTDMVEKHLRDTYGSISAHPFYLDEAQKMFYDDPMRQHLIKHLATVKLICERPRFLIKRSSTPDPE